MRIKFTSLLASAAFLAGTALTAPAFADTTAPVASSVKHPIKAIKQKLARHKAEVAFNNLSADGQIAIADVLAANMQLADNDSKEATNLLKKAQASLKKAASADSAFTAAMNQLNPKLKLELAKQQQAVANKDGANPSGATKWIPVGAEIVAVDKLSASDKAVVAKANSQLRSGDTKQAAATLRSIGQDLDFIIALAPLAATTDAVDRAVLFAEQGQTQEAVDAITTATNGIVFLSQNVIEDNGKTASALKADKKAVSAQKKANAAQASANKNAQKAQDAQATADADAQKAQAANQEAGLAPGAPADTDPDVGPTK
ncbi:YfdX family protein [Acetobacteraceae bacterium]|nr:YfdX family protein [Acetobacteraceae bacterium]